MRDLLWQFVFKWQPGEPTDSLISAAAVNYGLWWGAIMGWGNFINKISKVFESCYLVDAHIDYK